MCPRCYKQSYHPEDKRQGYCNACHWWTGDPLLGSQRVLAWAEEEGVIDEPRERRGQEDR